MITILRRKLIVISLNVTRTDDTVFMIAEKDGRAEDDSRICKNIKNCFAGYICMVANAAMADELRQHHIKYWNSFLNYEGERLIREAHDK
jgi:hypothetical protein